MRVFLSQNRRVVVFVLFMLLGSALLFVLSSLRTAQKNSFEIDKTRDPSQAQTFESGDYYAFIDQNENNLSLTEKDLALFAHTTLQEYQDTKKIVGFVFDRGYTNENDNYIFKGKYIDSSDTIKLVVKKFDKGIIRLSITNESDGTNIDDSLSLNGVKNQLIEQLPIDEEYYSISYFYSNDEIVVAFYEGFTITDVDRSIEVLKNIYKEDYREDAFRYNINGVGTFTLAGVFEYLQQR